MFRKGTHKIAGTQHQRFRARAVQHWYSSACRSAVLNHSKHLRTKKTAKVSKFSFCETMGQLFKIISLRFFSGNNILSGLVRFRGIHSGRNNKCTKKIVIWTRIYSGSKINLSIIIGRTRDRRVGLVPHLLTSGLIPSLLVYLSWAN
jgi:hypothetical protein